MMAVWLILGAVALVVLIGSLHAHRRKRQRAEARRRPFTDAQRGILRVHVPLYGQMPELLRPALEGEIQVFLHEISFEPCGGVEEVTETMRLVIASQACLLLLESGYPDFGKLRTVLIYPDAFVVKSEFEMESIRLGESWQTGSVVLSWQSVVQGSRNPEDGLNIVLHEFAHQIDQVDGVADGLPILRRRGDYRGWAEAFGGSFDLLCERVNRGERTVLDDYGATNPAEFFAVATETFFEKPKQLKREHTEVYSQLQGFYGLDPHSWI